MRKRYWEEISVKTKRITAIAIFLFVVCQLVGCVFHNKEENVNNEQIQNITELIEHIYSDAELTDIWRFKGSLSELNQKYPVECLRVTETMKSVVYLSEHNIVFVYFDRNGNQSAISNKYGLKHTSAEFMTLQIGDTLTDVMEFDPDGSYLFLYTGVKSPRGSTHCTKDGYLVLISYDEHSIITSIDIHMI
jgi:hypothetical protein